MGIIVDRRLVNVLRTLTIAMLTTSIGVSITRLPRTTANTDGHYRSRRTTQSILDLLINPSYGLITQIQA